MLKKLFGIFIPLCIFSFIAFGVSAAVLGTGYGSTDYAEASMEYDALISAGSGSSWEINEGYTNIRLDAGAYNITFVPGEAGDDTTYFYAERSSNNYGDIYTDVVGDTLEITIGNSYLNFGFDYLERLFEAIRTGEGFDNIFSGCSLNIVVPPRIYESIEVNIGSGRLEMTDINAQSNTLYLNSGMLSYVSGTDFIADSMDIEVGSGYIQANGMHTREYDIDINSGTYEIFGLSGDGEIDVNSGSGTIEFYRLDGDCDVYMNSGTLGIYVPYNASAKLTADINSGGVYVSAEESDSRMRDGDIITLGGGEYEMNLTLNSGRVTVSALSYAESEAVTPDLPQIDFGIVANGDSLTPTGAVTSIVEEQVESAVEIAAENISYFVEAPEAPKAPSAPKPPKAPQVSALALS